MKKYLVLGLMAMGTLTSASASETKKDQPRGTTTMLTEEFKKVTSKELTPKVVEQLLKEYPTSKLGGVYKNNNGEFKLIMVLKSGTRRTVYIDEHGNWLNRR